MPRDYASDLARHFPYIGLWHVGRRMLDSLDVRELLERSCNAKGVGVMMSPTDQDMAGRGGFAGEMFGQQIFIGYYRALEYANLYGNKDFKKMYGEGVMAVSLEGFQASDIHIYEDVEDNNEKCCPVWVVPTQLNQFHFRDD